MKDILCTECETEIFYQSDEHDGKNLCDECANYLRESLEYDEFVGSGR